jgi:hypothetical protein
MKTLGLLPFRLGHGAASPLTGSELDFYQHLAKEIIADDCCLVQNGPVPTIAVDSETLNQRQDLERPADLLLGTIETLQPVPQVVLVDLDVYVGADLRGAAYLYLASAIAGSLAHLEDRKAATERMIVMVPELQPGRSAFQRVLAGYLADQRLVLLTDDGDFLPETALVGFNRDKYRTEIAAVRGKPIDLLDRKLIRQYGHFRRMKDGRHHECVRVFFDGKLCGGEVRSLISSYIAKQYTGEDPPVLLHHSTLQNWLEGPVERLAAERSLECYACSDIENDEEVVRLFQNRNVLLVLPLRDTGRTLTDRLGVLCERMHVKKERIRVLSILSTEGPQKRHGTLTDVDGVPVDYFLRVHQQRYAVGGTNEAVCPMCRVDFPFTVEGVDQCHMLTSYDFWDMACEVGLKDEDHVPSNRGSLGKVPDFPKMLRNHGAWLAMKIGDLVEHYIDSGLSDLLVVCPEQQAAEMLTHFLSEVLGAVLGVNVVRVADNDIGRLRNGEALNAESELEVISI